MRNTAVILLIISFAGAVWVASGRPSAHFLLGQVGMGASVPSNPYNTLAEQLSEWEGELDAREQSLNERQALAEQGSRRLERTLGLAVLVIGLLLGLNYYLDWHRRPLAGGQSRPEQP